MNLKGSIAKIFAKIIAKKESHWIQNPLESQHKIFQQLIATAQDTAFGKGHQFASIQDYESFKAHVPVRDYEGLKTYIDRIAAGEENVLWKGKPLYLAKTSGTTSGSKYIPITKDSMPYHITAARNALLAYIHQTGRVDFVSGKMIFLQGSPELQEVNGIRQGRLSGIVAHYVPKYLQKNRMPRWETNCIADWEEKINQITRETLPENMSLISGIPPWLVMYFERLTEASGKKTVREIFPNLQLLVTGGVNFNPYREKVKELIGEDLPVIQTYPASEGFIAYQNDTADESLLLLLNHGIFYEFIPTDEFFNENPTRIALKDVELNKDYVLILNTNAGLWGYNIGDTIRFTSLNPYKIIVSGRVKHYTSAFGEHVIAHEVEAAMQQTLSRFPAQVSEFTVAPQVNPAEGLPHHEWFVEFAVEPDDLEGFEKELDARMRALNAYYDDLIKGKTLRPLKVSKVRKNGFHTYMKSQGKLGGQNKVPRLSNDRKIASVFYELQLLD